LGLIDLFRPKWKHSNENKRKSAVAHLTNRQILSVIAIHDSSSKVRACAVDKLVHIASSNDDESGIQAGIATLGDEDLLELISFWKMTSRTRHAIVDHMKSQNSLLEALIKASKYGGDDEFMRYVVAKVVDVDLLYAVLSGERGHRNQIIGGSLLDAELATIAGEIAAVKEDAILFILVMRGWDYMPGIYKYYPAEILIQGIEDQAILKRIIYEFDSDRCKHVAIERLSDPATLAEIAINVDKFNRGGFNDLSLLAAQVLGNCKDPQASSKFLELLKSISNIDRLLKMIDIIAKMSIISPEIKTEIGNRIDILRKCFSSEPKYRVGMKEYDGDYYSDIIANERYKKLKSAIKWIENL
jgi:hypothetical protein